MKNSVLKAIGLMSIFMSSSAFAVNLSGVNDCTAWLPSVKSVPFGAKFNQTSMCVTKEVSDGKGTVVSTFTRSRVATGMLITETAASSESVSMSPNGTYTCTVWSPSSVGVAAGESLAQTRSCTIGYDKVTTSYSIIPNGSSVSYNVKSITKATENKVENQSRVITGENNQGETTSTWSEWVNGGSPSCGTWSPNVTAADVPTGEVVNQERSCNQPIKRTRTVTKTASNGVISITTEEQVSSQSTTEYNTVVGVGWSDTRDCEWYQDRGMECP